MGKMFVRMSDSLGFPQAMGIGISKSYPLARSSSIPYNIGHILLSVLPT